MSREMKGNAMVIKTRNWGKKPSLRRSFRTRPSNQSAVIYVDHNDVKLFDSWDENSLSRCPGARKPRKRKDGLPKVFANTTNLPSISDFDDEDESKIARLNEEINMADDFSLYIEDEDGVRMKRVGNKLVRYDEYYRHITPAEDTDAHKIDVAKHPSSAERKADLREIRKATWALLGRLPPFKQRRSNPFEELPSESVETLFVEVANKENLGSTIPTTSTTFATARSTSPKDPQPVRNARQRSLANASPKLDAFALTPVRRTLPSLSCQSTSTQSEFDNVPPPELSSTPISKCLPQAQSTPFGRENLVQQNHSAMGSDSFDNPSEFTIPQPPSPLSVKHTECGVDQHSDKELHISNEGHNSATHATLATLAEEAAMQCTNIGRNTTSLTINTTYRNVSHLKNRSLVDIPYYLLGYRRLNTGTPLSQLLYVIDQAEVMRWNELPEDVFNDPRKLGEGVYGEVFATTYNAMPTALKVIPFHGDVVVYKERVNGEYLLDATSILPEILINRELSALSDPAADYSTPNFIQLLKTNVVKGLYPESFMVAWDEFDEVNGSENDRPSTYASDEQLFVTMSMAMGGVDLEHYQMKNEDEVMSTLLQIAISLVVAEERLEFEHRDLHIGNVLVQGCNEDVKYRFGGSNMTLRSHGVKVNLIDFTLSRMSKDGTTIFRDLENDEELFTGSGDYQFDIYRMMRKSNEGDWLAFNPKSNCFWLHYLSVQLIAKRKCKKAISKKRRHELQKMWDHLLEFESVCELFTHDDFYDVLQKHIVINP